MTTKSIASLSAAEQEALAARFIEAVTNALVGGKGLLMGSPESVQTYEKQFSDLVAFAEEYTAGELKISLPLGITMRVVRGLFTREAALEKRVAELEARPQLKYLGVHENGVTYPAGSAVTFRGGVWIATKTTSAAPGGEEFESRSWRLAVKAGRDGKDLR